MNIPPPQYISGTDCIVDEDHQYTVPTKLISNLIDMQSWQKSQAYLEYLAFILTINKSVESVSNSTGSLECSQAVNNICDMLDDINKLIDDTPAVEQLTKYGNIAFRTFYEKVKKASKLK